MNAYEKGLSEAGTRKDRYRRYQTDKAEKDYWRGYIDGMRKKLKPGESLVQCEREGTIFAVTLPAQFVDCPTCGRLYYFKDGEYMSDRKLTILE